MTEAFVVVDLGFGDAGKGSVTDFLARDLGADLVLRFNGGAQAGHNVVTPDGRHHTFSQLGAGTFAGARTHLGPAFVLHPGALLVEIARLARAGVPDALLRLTTDRRATLISPFQQAAGRLRELVRGDGRHGTCGVGVGEAVADAARGGDDVLCAADLGRAAELLARLRRQQERKRAELVSARHLTDPRARQEWALLDDPDVPARAASSWAPLALGLRRVEPEEARATFQSTPTVLFEGAQGVLLDQTWGFHPHTTWSDCTPAGALELLAGVEARVVRLGVLRAYATRHGEGPLPTHDPALDRTLPEAHNESDPWQGRVRRGPLDLVLVRYALEVAGGVDALALTCLDRVGAEVAVCLGYAAEGADPSLAESDAQGNVRRLVPGVPSDLEQRARLTGLLGRVRPRIERVARRDLVSLLEREIGVPVALESRGPSAAGKRWRIPPAAIGRRTEVPDPGSLAAARAALSRLPPPSGQPG